MSARKSAFVRFRERETDREMEEFAAWALRNNEPCEICNSRQEDLEIHLMGSLGRITLTCPACYQKSVARAEGYHAALEYRDRATSGGGGFWDWLKGLA